MYPFLPENGQPQEHTIVPAGLAGNPFVVHRDPAGKYHSFETDRYVTIRHDTITYNLIGVTSTVLYLVNGKLRNLLTSD
jgi:hypothetical protein